MNLAGEELLEVSEQALLTLELRRYVLYSQRVMVLRSDVRVSFGEVNHPELNEMLVLFAKKVNHVKREHVHERDRDPEPEAVLGVILVVDGFGGVIVGIGDFSIVVLDRGNVLHGHSVPSRFAPACRAVDGSEDYHPPESRDGGHATAEADVAEEHVGVEAGAL